MQHADPVSREAVRIWKRIREVPTRAAESAPETCQEHRFCPSADIGGGPARR